MAGEVPLLRQEKLSRKERRERQKYAPVLTKLANQYLEMTLNNDIATPEIIQHHFNNIKNAWKDYVHRWNRNPKHVTELKETDLEDLLEDVKERNQNEA
jgi:hypothetical protein